MFDLSCEAIVPFYDHYGQNACYTLHTDGSKQIHNYPVRSYIYHMLQSVHLDPRTLNHWTYTVLKAKLNTPIILDDYHVYIPVKLRKSVSKADGTMGYVLSSAIEDISEEVIKLHSGVLLPILSSSSCIYKKQKDAALLCYAYRDQKKQYEFMRF